MQLAPDGLATPRWSVTGQRANVFGDVPTVVGLGTRPIAALPGRRVTVWVGPPKLPRAVSWVARLASVWREGDCSVIEFHWLVARKGERVRHYAELLRNRLVGAEEMLGSFRRAGFRAKVLRHEPYRDRGLYVGIRPPEA